MEAKTYHSTLFATFGIISLMFFIVSLPTFSSAEDEADHDHRNHHGNFISVELIHRDSPNSPLYSPSESPRQRLAKALQRSNHRVNQFKKSLSILSTHNINNTAQSDLFLSGGDYLMNISIGSPPLSVFAIADTGSDLIWTQCKPCQRCFKQKGTLFDPKSSSTYELLSCKSKECKYLSDDIETSCYPKNYFCRYGYKYGDQSFTTGNLALETVALPSSVGNPILFPKTIFGCGFHNGGIFGGVESGIIGLGTGKLSLVSQMGSSINGRFSYCLVPISSRSQHSSKMNFGGALSLVSGPHHGKVSTTPLLSNGVQSYYYLALEAVSLGNKKFDLSRNNVSKAFKGNIIIDSGTTLTYLPRKLYNELELEMRNAVKHLKLAKDPNQELSLCYKTKSHDINAPTLTFHFDGADVELKSVNIFLRIEEDVICFAFTPTEDILIYGNLVQMNFLVQYDLIEKIVSFKPSDCTKQY